MRLRDIYAEIISAAHSGSFGMNSLPHPTAEQLKAGNYRKGKVKLHGMTIAIETPQGQRRMGKSDGQPWSVICMAHYGYIVGTKASDGDAIDVYVGPVPESTRVWVVNQNDKAGNFDEVKVLLGFHDEQSARAAYMNSYERGWTGLGSLIACSIDQFRWWLKFGDTTKPLTDRALPHEGNTDMTETVWDSAANPVGCEVADLIYRLRGEDREGLMLDAVTVDDILEASDGEMTLDALVVQYNQVERKAEQLRRIMESVGGDVKPLSVQITPPFKQRGTTNVVILFELSDGQTVSVWMHNPDSTPNRIKPDDELVSWAWRLNKKDVSIIVAPEKGQDLNPREVSRRIMRLAEKNSARFAKANAGRAERMANIEGMRSAVAEKEATLAALDTEHAELTVKVEAKRNRVPATLQGTTQGADTEIEMNQQAAATLPPSTVRNQAVKAALAELGWNTAPSSTQVMVAIDGSVYSLTSSLNEVRGKLVSIDWNDSGWKFSDTLTLEPAAFAAELDKAFRASIAAARQAVVGGDLPAGWTEQSPGGMATNQDPENGGIVDKAIVDGQWFAVFNRAGMPTLDGFATRADAFRAFAAALAAGWSAEATAKSLEAMVEQANGWKSVESQASAMSQDQRNALGAHYGYEGAPMAYVIANLVQAAVSDRILTPEGYAKVMADEALQLANQDKLDSFFGSRLVAVRNALRDLGWDGERGSVLTKGAYTFLNNTKNVGAGRNVVGVRYEVTTSEYGSGFEPVLMVDDLTKTPEQIAAEIDGAIRSTGPQSLEALARSLIPAEFKSIGFDGEGYNFVAEDGLGIRLRSGPRGQVLGYVVEGSSYDSLGARGTDPAQVKDLVDTALGVIETKRGDMVIMDIIGRDAVMVGKTRFESGNGGFYSTGRNSKPLTAAMLKADGSSFELDDYALLRQAGVVTLSSVGSENVYFTLRGVPYFTKLLNTDNYEVGQVVDLSDVKEPAYEPPVAALKGATLFGVAAILKSNGWVERGSMTWDRGSWHVAGDKGNIVVSEYVDGELVERGTIAISANDGAMVKAIEDIVDGARADTRLKDKAQVLELFKSGELAELNNVEPGAYMDAMREFLEGDLSDVKLAKRDMFEIPANANINPQAIDKGVVEIKRSAESLFKVLVTHAGDKDVRSYLNGVHYELENGIAAASDGYRMMIVKGLPQSDMPVKPESAPQGATVLGTDGQWIEGRFPDWRRVTNRGRGEKLIFNAREAAAKVRGAVRVGEVMRTRYGVAVPFIIDGKGSYVSARYVLQAITAMQKLGYKKFSIQPNGNGTGVFIASPDNRVNIVIMGIKAEEGQLTPITAGLDASPRAAEGFTEGDVAAPANDAPKPDFATWEEAFYSAIEEQGDMSRSDAQGVAEAQGDMMNDQYAAGSTPEAAASIVLTASTQEIQSEKRWSDSERNAIVKQIGKDISIIKNQPDEAGVSQRRSYIKVILQKAQEQDPEFYLAVLEKFPDVLQVAGGDSGQAPDNTVLSEAKQFLNDVIAGNVDYMDETLADRLEAVATQYEGDAEVQQLFEKAANAYSAYMIEQARAAMA